MSVNTTETSAGLPIAEAPARPGIFNYLNYREFLKAFYQFKKLTQTRYSYAVFSMRAGIKSPNYLKLVIEGSRNVTNDNILPFAKALGLNDLETVYWENLVAFNQAKTQTQRAHYLVKLTHSPLPPGESFGKTVREIRDEWEYYSSWHHAAIRELVLLLDFSEDPQDIVRKLKNRVSLTQAKASLELLERMKFLIRNAAGGLVQAEREIRYFNKDDLRNIVIQKFHHSTAELAIDSIENDPANERDFSGLTIAVTRESLPALKKKVTELRKELNREFSKLENGDLVLQINFQVIPLTAQNKEGVKQ